MRIVLDTNILVRASAKARGPARELLQLIVASPRHVLLLSPFLLQELERVLSYERIRTLSKLTEAPRAFQRLFSRVLLPVLCRLILMMIQWFILP
jgi:predicted nucleic acid-binding protein